MTVVSATPIKAEGPQPLIRKTPSAPPFPVEALGPLRAPVEAAHEKTQAPVALAAQSALSIASLAVQCHGNVETLGGTAPTSLYCLSVAKSGERKSATDDKLMSGLYQYEREAAHEYQAKLQTFDNIAEIWQTSRDAIMAGFKKKDANRPALTADLENLGPAPEPPLKPYLTATEPTLEGLHKLYMQGQPGLGIFSDEGGAFLGSYGMSRDNRLRTLAGLSDLWGGKPIRRVRAGDGASAMYERRLAMHLMAQPVAAQEILTDQIALGQGFLARFLITQPQSAIGTRLGIASGHAAVLDQFSQRLRQILDAPKPLVQGSRQELRPKTLGLSAAARELLWTYYQATETAQAPGGDLEDCTSFASKSPEQACRIAGVLTLWNSLQASEIGLAEMALGVSLAQYYLYEAKRLSDAAVIPPDIQDAEKLRVWLIERWSSLARAKGRDPDTVLPRDILQYGPNALRDKKRVGRAMDLLTSTGNLLLLEKGAIVDDKVRREAYKIGALHVD